MSLIPSLDHYELTERLSQSDATRVFRGRRRADGEAVTIKLPRSDRPRPQALATLRHEYNLLRDLDIPGVIRVLGLDEVGDGLALIEEAVAGAPLTRLLSHGPLSLERGLRLARALARILDGLHEAGVIHKDIKPDNIIVDSTNLDTHLIDFGIATRLTHASTWQSRPDNLEGTLAYMSPEQTGRTNRVIDPRSDLYSLGVTLYQVFTGSLPFVTDDVMELVHSHIAREPTPPHERVRSLPRVLSSIILRLLAKAPEDRYQTARGLCSDLELCLDQLAETGALVDFPLGTDDQSAVLRVHRELYGREQEIAALGEAFGRVCEGRPELALVSGYSGVGKSALIYALHRPVAAAGGWLVSGKFELLDRGTPYAPITAALGMLIRQLLGEREESLTRWRERLLSALGRNAGLLIPLVPELELVIGRQPEVDELAGDAAQNRFRSVFVAFLCAFASAERPLVLFLDDLQWIDSASLRLLEHVMTASEPSHLLVIGAYRDNEVDDAHPLSRALERLRSAGACAVELTLAPLGEALTRRWLADTLHQPDEALEGLATLVHAKTRGNPFFVTHFLRALHEGGMLRFDREARRWVWDLAAIAVAQVTDNVAELLAAKLGRLPPVTLDLVKRAACLGHTFLLSTLATIAACSLASAAERLSAAIDAGMIIALDAGHRLLSAEVNVATSNLDIAVRYRFLHDRVHQAAYSLIADDQRQAWHLGIGRLLRAELAESPADDALFECIRHLRVGEPGIDDADERHAIARLALEAGLRARRSIAFTAAAALFAAGIHFLGDDGWTRDPALCFALHREQTEAEAMCGRFEVSEALARRTLAHTADRRDRVAIETIRLLSALRQGDPQTAYAIGVDVCRLYDLEIPSDLPGIYAATGAALAEIAALLGERPLTDFLDRPPLTDPELIAYQSFMVQFSSAVFVANRSAFGIPTLQAMLISMKHGHSPWSAHAYGGYVSLLSAGMGRYEEAREAAEFVLKLLARGGNPSTQTNARMMLSSMGIYFWPIDRAIAIAEEAVELGLSCGEFVFTGYAALLSANMRMSRGAPLPELLREFGRLSAVLKKIRDPLAMRIFRMTRQLALVLRGETDDIMTLGNADFDEAEALADAKGEDIAHARYFSIKLTLAVLGRDVAAATDLLDQAAPHIAAAGGNFFQIDLIALVALSRFAAAREAEGAAREAHLASGREQLAPLLALAASATENVAHKVALVRAAEARALGDVAAAMAAYDAAIAGAQASNFINDEALASELAGEFYRELGRDRIAALYLADARSLYLRWGATAKAIHLVRRHPALLDEADARSLRREPSLTTSTRMLHGGALDVTSVMLAAQTIASELDLGRLLEKIMRIVLTSAGATRCALVLVRGEVLRVEAMLGVAAESLEVGIGALLEERDDLPASLLLYVARARDTVVLGTDVDDPRFRGDAFLSARMPRSLVATALTHQARLVGVLYLENEAAERTFTRDRVELLRLLSTQAAIAVETAQLHAEREARSAELREINEDLGRLVHERTEALRATNQRLVGELEERSRREAEHSALQVEIIRMQEERLRELSTPLIPITPHIVVMPLIGAMDGARARQVLEVALHGAQSRGAKVVILDVTGMSMIDTTTADTIVRCANALGLLGAEAVITGIQPAVARILVELGVDLRSETRNTLQSGIAYALARTGEYEALRVGGGRRRSVS